MDSGPSFTAADCSCKHGGREENVEREHLIIRLDNLNARITDHRILPTPLTLRKAHEDVHFEHPSAIEEILRRVHRIPLAEGLRMLEENVHVLDGLGCISFLIEFPGGVELRLKALSLSFIEFGGGDRR